jgi:group I intron endonuclease
MSYVGQSVDGIERWKDHLYEAFRTTGKIAKKKKRFLNALRLHGREGFMWQIIDHCETLEEANELEEFYISYLGTLTPNGYNLLPGGNNRRLSEKTKKQIGETLKTTSFFVGKRGKDHPNFGTHISEERKKTQSIRFSGDGSSGKKINSQTARQLYLDYLHDDTTSSRSLGLKYGLKKGATFNILSKKCWKDATRDLPDINFAERARGEKWMHAKLTENQVLEIIEKYKSGNYTMQQLGDEYHLCGSGPISNIISGKSWKHIKR